MKQRFQVKPKLINKILIMIMILFISCKKQKPKTSHNFNLEKFIINYKIPKNTNDSILVHKLKDTLYINKNEWYVILKYQHIFKNEHIYILILDQFKNNSYNWFKKTDTGFVKFFERKIIDASFIKDTIFDINNDGVNEMVVTKMSGGIGGTYKIIYFLNTNGLIKSECRISNYFNIKNNQFILVTSINSPIIALEKCQWNGTNIDTIENISLDSDKKIIVKYKKKSINNNKPKAEIIDNLPKEYLKALDDFYKK